MVQPVLTQYARPSIIYNLQITKHVRRSQCSHGMPALHADLLVWGSDPVLNGSARCPPPNPELNHPPLVQPRTPNGTTVRFRKVRVRTKVRNQTAATYTLKSSTRCLDVF